jgi:hypothetical protein
VADRIQRVPRGLNELLSLVGGKTPTELEERVRPTLELLQFYGLTQRRLVASTNAALGSGTTMSVTLPGASWNVLFAASFAANGVAAFTSLALQLRVNGLKVGFLNVANPAVAFENSISFVPPYPMLLEPGSSVEGFIQTAGAATAACALQVLAAPMG